MAGIEFERVEKRFGAVQVIAGLDLAIRDGEFVVLLGESGCGKTTLLRMLAGLESVTGGAIKISGQTVNELEPKDRGCAMVFQNYALFPHMNVRQNLGYGMKIAKVPEDERERRIGEAAELLSISHLLERRPSQLSGGQRQRVAIGRAIVRQPKVFLFDEPLSNLDAKLRGEMRIELRKLHERIGATSIFVTHDQTEAMTLADRIVVMNKGRIEQLGTPDEIYNKPRTLFVAGFIGSPPMNLLEGTISGQGSNRVLYLLGTTIQMRGAASQVPEGPVMVGIRPEAATLAHDGGIPVRAVGVENLGAVIHLHCEYEGQRLIVAVPAGEPRLADKASLRIALDPSQLHFFRENQRVNSL